MTSANILWWAVYIIAGIWLQKWFPGLDALVPALIVCLNAGNKQQTVVFLLICVVIQEGTGTLPFGASIIWYSTVIAAYYIGGWFFMSGNLMFILILSISMGVSRALISAAMGLLQPLPFDSQFMLGTYVLQIVCTPVIWFVADKTRRMLVSDAY